MEFGSHFVVKYSNRAFTDLKLMFNNGIAKFEAHIPKCKFDSNLDMELWIKF